MAYLPREYCIQHPDDDFEVFEKKMNDILDKDDVNKLHEYVQGFEDRYHYPALLDLCLDVGAKKCALHIIQGNLPHGPPLIGADHCEPKPKLPVLYQVINTMCEPRVFHLLFTRCNAESQVNQPFLDLLPLHWLLHSIVVLYPLYLWSPEKPLSRLIDLFILSRVSPKLKCARMLAQHTHSLDQIALGYIQNEEIIHLTALLLVAPFTPGEFETIKQYASIKSIASQAVHGQSVTPATKVAAALLYTFDKDGDKFTTKLNNPRKRSSQAAEGKRLVPEPEKRLAQVSRGGQTFADHSIQQIGNFIDFVRRLFSKSSQMAERTGADEICGSDANLSSDHYLLLHSLLKESEGSDTFRLLQANLSRVNEEVLHSQGDLLALISAIRTICNNNDNATEHFESVDARHVNLIFTCLLHLVLGSLVKYDYLSKWSPGQSLVKLILLLFLQPELRPTLECAQLIAKGMNSVNEVAWKLIQQGELIQLAGLLLVARKKAMEPFVSGHTIKEATSMEIVSQVFCGESVTATTGAAGLFEIFEVAGDTLAKYWSIHNDEHEPAGVIVEVATRIQHSGIQVLSTDVDLTDIYSASSHPEMLKSIRRRLGIKIDNTSGLSQISRQSAFPKAVSVLERCRPMPPLLKYPWLDTTELLKIEFRSRAFDKLGSRSFSTSSRIVERVRGGTLKHSSAWPSTSPRVRDMVYLAMKLKRRVRLV